jgi:hypothetical protein
MNHSLAIAYVRSFNAAVDWEGFEIAPPYMLDMERLSVLTVVAGLRPRALLVHVPPRQISRLRDLMINCGLHCHLDRQDYSTPLPGFDPKLTNVMNEHYGDKAKTAIWLCHDREARRRVLERTQQVGTLLEYPACCVKLDLANNQTLRVAFLKSLIQKVGPDPVAVRRALSNDMQVEMSPEAKAILESESIGHSLVRFPFVFHVACPDCMAAGDESPSGQLNARFKKFAFDVDPELRDRLVYSSEKLMSAALVSGE